MNAAAPVRWSILKHMLRSPAHCRYAMDNGIPVTPAMRFGTVVGSIVLGSTSKFVIWDGGDRRGKEWKEFEAANAGTEIVKRCEYDEAYKVANAVLLNADARALLKGAKEQRISWEIAGRACTGTPDARPREIVADLKVTADARPERLHWHALKMGWLGQLAWYANGLELSGAPIREAYIIAVEPKPPFPVVVYEMTEAAMTTGRKQWRLAWERFRACEESGHWPGYVETIVPLEIPEDVTLTIEGEEVPL